ncbi:MAG: OmpA family protein [Phenylobacterium sp.]
MTLPMKPVVARLAMLAAVCLAMLAGASIASAQTGTLRGIITARNGDQMTVTTSDGANHVFVLDGSTRAVAVAGGLGLRQNDQPITELLNGLPVTVESVTHGQYPTAVKVTFKESDLKTARQIEAGTAQAKTQAREKLAEADRKNEALKERLSQANQYVAKGEVTVYFASGSTAIDAKSQKDLKDLAAKALTIKGYMIGVTGHADSRGDAHANQVLSEKRANAVIRYLQKNGGIQPYRVLAQNAMGEDRPTAQTVSTGDMAQDRRVVVQILTNKGLEGL